MKFSMKTLFEYGALVGLYTAGISHPIMQVVSEEAPFFIFHQAGWKTILTYWLLIVVITPVIMLSLLHVIKLISSRAYGFCHKASYLVLVILFVSFTLNSVYRELGLVTFVIAALVFTVLFLYLFRTKAGAAVATALSLLLIINAWQFFLVSDISHFFNAGQNSQTKPLIQPSSLYDKPPVFFLVFDELGTVSLLDKSLNIDRKSFPNFFAFSEDAHWFRNASTVSVATNESIPALVTGNYPVSGYPPVKHSYPNNILRLFDQQAGSLISEPTTDLGSDKTIAFNGRSLAWMLLDSSIIYAHLVLPSKLLDQLPSIRQSPGRFLDGNKTLLAVGRFLGGNKTQSADGRVTGFREFISQIRYENRFQFYFAHVLLPHVPWKNTASLKLYAKWNIWT